MKEFREQLMRRAFQSAPHEACGFVLDDGTIIEVANVATDTINGFEMDRADVAKRFTEEQFSRIWAIWHTHSNGSMVPSARDLQAISCGAVQPHWVYLIATAAAVTEWNPNLYAPQDVSFWSGFLHEYN